MTVRSHDVLLFHGMFVCLLLCVVWRGGRLNDGWCRGVGAVVCGGIIVGKYVDWYDSEIGL